MIEFRLKPLVQWPHTQTRGRKRSPFKAGMNKVNQDLRTELAHIGTKGTVWIEAGFRAEHIRNDGLPRADAPRPSFPGVVVYAPETKKGPMRFASDTYTDWQGNLRGITLTLTALRAVARYGAVRDNEQYKGFAALPPPAPADFGTVEAAATWCAAEAGMPHSISVLITHPDMWRNVYRTIAGKHHPDRNEGQAGPGWSRLQAAAALLDKHHGK